MKYITLFIIIFLIFFTTLSYSIEFKDIFIFQNEVILEENSEVSIAFISCLEVDSKGNFWISDWDNNQVIMFDKEGKNPRIIARKGKGPGEVIMPDEIYLDKHDHLFVSTFSNRISEFDAEGKFIRSFQCTDGHFPTSDIVISSQGNIYIAGRKYSTKNKKSAMIHLYTLEGKYIKSFYEIDPLIKERDLDMFNSACLAMDDQDQIYASQPVTYKISVFNNQGDFLRTIGKKQSYYKEPKPLSRDIRTNPDKLKEYKLNFTYMAELFIINNMLIAISMITGGLDGNNDLYFIDCYDKFNGNTIFSGVKTEKRLRCVKEDKLYFITTIEYKEVNELKYVIQIYKIRNIKRK